ncbi:MAG: hypothetical protein J6Y78_11095 [Paludibacteraceae bacterium]|nr:hypothetical protein [Paludibacteraceae bacterium]
MILKYKLTDNRLIKDDETMYPNHLQDNIKLEFMKSDELPNSKYYLDIKTVDVVKRLRLKKYEGVYSCDLPKWVTSYPFFKLQAHTVTDNKHFTTNELIIPVRCLDYLDYNRAIAHSFKQPQREACYKDDFKREQTRHDYYHELEELLVQNLEEKGVETKSSDTLKDLINKIKEINNG